MMGDLVQIRADLSQGGDEFLDYGDLDDNLSHAILRAMFAYEVDHERERTNGYA